VGTTSPPSWGVAVAPLWAVKGGGLPRLPPAVVVVAAEAATAAAEAAVEATAQR